MNVSELFEKFQWSVISQIAFIDILQMVILAAVIMYLFNTLYKTRAWLLVKGVMIIAAVYFVVYLTNMTVLQNIMQEMFSLLMIAIVLMLQPELQKIVENVGSKNIKNIRSFFSQLSKKEETEPWLTDKNIYEVVEACEDMSAVKTGALIVFERNVPLTEYIESGITVKPRISNQLLINIFEKNTPLHDGAVIVRNNHIEAATCYLPLSTSNTIDKHLGTRHRAAIGITEITDAVVVVVSEETGAVSICVNGKITHKINRNDLTKQLHNLSSKTETIDIKGKAQNKEKNKDGSKSKEKGREKSKKKKKFPIGALIFSILASFGIWFTILGTTDPKVSATITNIPVTVLNEDAIGELNQTYTVESGSKISIKIKAPRSVAAALTASDFSATADLTEMSMVYAVPIRVSVSNKYKNDVEIIDDSKIMKLSLSNIVQKEIPISVVQSGYLAENTVNVVEQEYETLTVSGPENIINTLDKAVLKINISGRSSDFVVKESPILYDKNGTVVDQKQLKLSIDTITVKAEVYDVKEVPITVELDYQNSKVGESFVLNKCELESDTILISAHDSVLADINELTVKVKLEGDTENGEKNVLLTLANCLPDGVVLAPKQAEQIKAMLDISKHMTKTFELTESDIIVSWNQPTVVSSAQKKNTKKYKEIVLDTFPENIIVDVDTSVYDYNDITLELLKPTLKANTEAVSGKQEAVLSITEIDGVSVLSDLNVSYRFN